MAQSTSTVAGPGLGLDLSSVTGRLKHHRRRAPGADERFTLAGEMPVGHPLFGDVPGRHDSLVLLEIVRQAGPFLGYRGLGVPPERPCLFSRLALRLADTSVWDAAGVEVEARAGAGAAMAVDLRVAPTKSVHGVPRGFRLSGALELDGALGCTGSAELVCLAPGVARHHRAAARLATLAAREAPYPAGPVPRPVAPGEVGRGDPANVVVSEPVPVPVRGADGLASVLVVDPAHPVFFAEATDSVPGLLLVEAVRQTAMLAAGRVVGLDVRRTVLAGLALRFRGFAELDLPVECGAGVLGVESSVSSSGRELRVVRVRLTATQAGRVVVEADGVAVGR